MELFHNEPSQLINTVITENGKEKKISIQKIFNIHRLKALLVSVSNGVDNIAGWGRCLKNGSFQGLSQQRKGRLTDTPVLNKRLLD